MDEKLTVSQSELASPNEQSKIPMGYWNMRGLRVYLSALLRNAVFLTEDPSITEGVEIARNDLHYRIQQLLPERRERKRRRVERAKQRQRRRNGI